MVTMLAYDVGGVRVNIRGFGGCHELIERGGMK
jgi:hypothetical protein